MSPSRPPPLQSPNPQRLYRSESHRVLAGVCGGLAEYWDIDVVVVRLGWIALLLFAFPIAFFGYLALAISIPKRPENLPESKPEERQFWREVSHKPGHTLGALRHRLRQIDRRIQRLEKHVTSRAFAVDHALKQAAGKPPQTEAGKPAAEPQGKHS